MLYLSSTPSNGILYYLLFGSGVFLSTSATTTFRVGNSALLFFVEAALIREGMK